MTTKYLYKVFDKNGNVKNVGGHSWCSLTEARKRKTDDGDKIFMYTSDYILEPLGETL